VTDQMQVGVRANGNDHELFVGDRTFVITDSQLLIFSRSVPTYLRRVVANKLQTGQAGLEPIAPVPVTDIHLNHDLLATQVHVTIDDIAGGSFDYALEPAKARHLAERLIARAGEIEAAAYTKQSH
jgi:hypothetical protein